MKAVFLITAMLFFTFVLFAQVNSNIQTPLSMNTSGDDPDASALLDLQSTEKGILIPRMASSQRGDIASPASGLLVFDSTTESFWFFNGTAWEELGAATDNLGNHLATQDLDLNGNAIVNAGAVSATDFSGDGSALTGISLSTLNDADGNTKIQLEESANEDMMRIDLAGTERLTLRVNDGGNTMLEYPNSGSANLFLGYNAGAATNTGSLNTFVGNSSGEFVTTSSYNAFFGRKSGYLTTTGSSNTYIGNAAGQDNTTGSFNTCVGQASGKLDSIGRYNTFLGANSGEKVVSGSNNVYLGMYSGRNNATGRNNVLLGYYAGVNSLESYRLFIESSNSNTPLVYGEFDNDLIRINGTFDATGDITGDANLTIDGNMQGFGTLSLTDGTQGLTLRTNATDHYVHIDVGGSSHSGDDIVIGEVGTGSDNNVGIGTNSPSYLLEVDGTAGKPGGGSWTSTSDLRLKQNVRPYTDGLESVLAIRPVRYQYNALSGFDTRKEYTGVIAQELQEVAPYMVGSYEKNGATYLNVDNSDMTFMLVNAVQELASENEKLEVAKRSHA